MRLVHKLNEHGLIVGQPLASHIATLDKRTYKAKNADDSGEDTELQEEQKEVFMG